LDLIPIWGTNPKLKFPSNGKPQKSPPWETPKPLFKTPNSPVKGSSFGVLKKKPPKVLFPKKWFGDLAWGP